jgi:signal recognition particle subunit SRP72
LDDGVGPEEAAEELVPVDAQVAFCAARLGRRAEAAAAYQKILAAHETGAFRNDRVTIAVVRTNLLALLGPRGDGAAELLKRVEKMCDRGGVFAENVASLESNPSAKRAVALNRAVSLIHANKLRLAKEMVMGSVSGVSVVRSVCGLYASAAAEAAIEAREGRPSAAVAALARAGAEFAKKGDVSSQRDCLLAEAHVRACSGEYVEAAAALGSAAALDSTLRAAPATAATLAALYDLAGDARRSEAALVASVARVSGSKGSSPPSLGAVLAAADAAFARGLVAEASAAYESVSLAPEASDEERSVALAGFAKASAVSGDLDAAERAAAAAFASARGDLSSLDADALEETLPASVAARAAEMASRMGRRRLSGVRVAEAAEAKKNRRRRKAATYPKNFDPADPGPAPDPERWLPLRERSSYKGKRKKHVNVRGAQGSSNVVAVEEKKKEGSSAAAAGSGAEFPGVEKLLAIGKRRGKKGRR